VFVHYNEEEKDHRCRLLVVACYNEEEDHQCGLLVLVLLLQRRKRRSPKGVVGACILLQLRNKRSPKWVVGARIVATTKKKKIITKVGCWCLHCCYN
jgi:hypothetical protein